MKLSQVLLLFGALIVLGLLYAGASTISGWALVRPINNGKWGLVAEGWRIAVALWPLSLLFFGLALGLAVPGVLVIHGLAGKVEADQARADAHAAIDRVRADAQRQLAVQARQLELANEQASRKTQEAEQKTAAANQLVAQTRQKWAELQAQSQKHMAAASAAAADAERRRLNATATATRRQKKIDRLTGQGV